MTATVKNNSGSDHLPKQEIGTEMNAVEKKVLNSEQEAIEFYEAVRQKLFNVSCWAEISKVPISTFKLMDPSGQEVERAAKEGDYLKIDIPGPGTSIGEGYDWVVIEEIKEEKTENMDLTSMTVRPAANPENENKDVAHFLKDHATSTFQVRRIGLEVSAEEHGRNEVPNSDTDHTLDNIRNTIVGWSAKIGFSYPQWKSLVVGLIESR